MMANTIPNYNYGTCLSVCNIYVQFFCFSLAKVFEMLVLTYVFVVKSGLVVGDLPYHIMPGCAWEYQITVAMLKKMINQLNAVNEADAWVLALMHKPTDSEIVRQGLTQNSNFQHLQHFFWHQKDQTSPTPVSSYTNCVQMGTLAFMPDRTKVRWNVNKDPRQRHNFISCKGVSKLHKNEMGKSSTPAKSHLKLFNGYAPITAPLVRTYLCLELGQEVRFWEQRLLAAMWWLWNPTMNSSAP
jgi:hypothetical protein